MSLDIDNNDRGEYDDDNNDENLFFIGGIPIEYDILENSRVRIEIKIDRLNFNIHGLIVEETSSIKHIIFNQVNIRNSNLLLDEIPSIAFSDRNPYVQSLFINTSTPKDSLIIDLTNTNKKKSNKIKFAILGNWWKIDELNQLQAYGAINKLLVHIKFTDIEVKEKNKSICKSLPKNLSWACYPYIFYHPDDTIKF